MDVSPNANISWNGIDRRTFPRRSAKLAILSVVVAAAIFALDISMPLGVAGAVPYVALVCIGWWFPKLQTIYFLAAASSVLTVVGFYYSPEGGIAWVVFANRAYALFAIWSTATILVIARQSRAQVQRSEGGLKYAVAVAKDASRTKSDMLANMSHELRTPLNAIIGFSEMVKEQTFGPLGHDKYCDYMDDIHQSGQHLLSLINDILDVSAYEVGALKLHKENIRVADIVDSAIRIVAAQATRGEITVTPDIDAQTPEIYADKRRVIQILLNLLSNAIKFTPEGGSINVQGQQNGDGSLSIVVSDTGVGMDAAGTVVAQKVFGQVDGGLSRKHDGSGLGLPLTMGLIELHGGTLEIKSAKGEGTAVTVTFPKDCIVEAKDDRAQPKIRLVENDS